MEKSNKPGAEKSAHKKSEEKKICKHKNGSSSWQNNKIEIWYNEFYKGKTFEMYLDDYTTILVKKGVANPTTPYEQEQLESKGFVKKEI